MSSSKQEVPTERRRAAGRAAGREGGHGGRGGGRGGHGRGGRGGHGGRGGGRVRRAARQAARKKRQAAGQVARQVEEVSSVAHSMIDHTGSSWNDAFDSLPGVDVIAEAPRSTNDELNAERFYRNMTTTTERGPGTMRPICAGPYKQCTLDNIPRRVPPAMFSTLFRESEQSREGKS